MRILDLLKKSRTTLVETLWRRNSVYLENSKCLLDFLTLGPKARRFRLESESRMDLDSNLTAATGRES